MSRTARAIATIQNTATKHGVKLPKKLTDALQAARHRDELYTQYKPAGIDLRTAITDALEAGQDPAYDATVTAAVVEAYILDHPASDDRGLAAASLQPHRDLILDAFKPAFNQAAADLADARETVTRAGYATLDDPGLITATVEVHEAAGRARAALQTISDIRAVNTAIANDGLSASKTTPWLAYIDPDSLPYPALAPHHREMLTPWDAVGIGATLALANDTEYRARVRAFKQARINHEEHMEELAYQERKRQTGWASNK